MQELMRSLLKEKKLYIADVGATGGPELRWKGWEELCFFYSFDPDPRAEPWYCTSRNYPVGLWSKKCTKLLTLASYPPATSLFKMNHEQVEAFLHHKSLKEVGRKRIQLDTLDQVLGSEPLDFLKIDAEGAELEILKGGEKILRRSCLGLQVEVLFCEIRKNAPTFSEIDNFARSLGFELFQLEREHWIRKNQLSTFESSPQLIWGNALYLLSKKAFLKRAEGNEELFLKYQAILLAYHLYDYAYELCEEVNFPSAKEIKAYLETLQKPKVRHLAKLTFSLLVGGGRYALTFSKKAKQHRLCYLKRKVRELGKACLYLGKNSYALYD